MTNDPTYDELIAYAAGELDPARAAQVRAHLARSPEAAATVARFGVVGQTLRTDDSQRPPTSILARAKALFAASRTGALETTIARMTDGVRRIVASLVFDSRPGVALAGFRGASQACQLSYEAEGREIDLEIQQGGSGKEWEIIGQINPPAGPCEGTVTLADSASGSVVASISLDDHGVFRVTTTPGKYDLLFSVGDSVIVAPGVEI